MAKFQPVTVTGLRKVARDAVEVTLAPQAPDQFHFEPGQYLTFSKIFDGVELRRSYSICSGPDFRQFRAGFPSARARIPARAPVREGKL